VKTYVLIIYLTGMNYPVQLHGGYSTVERCQSNATLIVAELPSRVSTTLCVPLVNQDLKR
jgi:hypothetical protein